MASAPQEKNVKVYKADTGLQARIGTGPLDAAAVKRSQAVIDNNTVDFAPLAMTCLDTLETTLQKMKRGECTSTDAVPDLTAAIMQLKANAAMFQYTLIGNLANVMLGFLESLKTLDANVMAIIEAHHKVLKAVMLNKMTGDGGAQGKIMEDELKKACARYFSKQG